MSFLSPPVSCCTDQVLNAVNGEFGDFHSDPRTKRSGSKLFINPLMTLYWSFDLQTVYDSIAYLASAANCMTTDEHAAVLHKYRASLKTPSGKTGFARENTMMQM